MSILCYVTNLLRKDVSSHGVGETKLERFAAEVESKQSLAGFDHFPNPCLTKKKIFGFNYRMIAVEKHFHSHVVIVLLRLVIRGGSEYAAFMADPPKWAMKQFDSEISDDILSKWIETRTKVKLLDPAPSLSLEEQSYLWTGAYSDEADDELICETEDWIKGVQGQQVASRLILLPELIVEATQLDTGEIQVLRSKQDQRLAILAFASPTKQCVLISVGYGEPEEELRTRRQLWAGRLSHADAETILRFSRRSYPSVICYDADAWMDVQKDPQANLALSPEEAEILRTSSVPEDSRTGFPLFINGRAGSGKSTLLQYLFAECVMRWSTHLRADPKCRPLYLASSRELLNVAHKVVGSLLRANSKSLLHKDKFGVSSPSDCEDCFQETLGYFRSLLGDEAESRFPLSKYVGYAKFRHLWVERFGKEQKAVREYGPQVSWHVIRGILKGMSVDGLMDKVDYVELPQDERTVSRAVFENVYDRVWSAWYEKLHKEGLAWDSQDLVRYLLDHDRIRATHSAVFCDEAQDFTRLELEAFYRCSLFSNRQVEMSSLKRVPFVFAGDPFQTLNPTGFRWESVRAAFTERILRSLYRFNSRTELPQLNYQELTFNYRSSQRIVHFCNSIQAVRARVFDHRSLTPQSTWQISGESAAPVFFEKGDAQIESALRDQSDLVLIVPCEEGEEAGYVASDEYLRSFVQSDSDGIPRNVLSASRAKGLEFLRVAIYGWAERPEARALAKRIRAGSNGAISQDERLGLEYFMNNLYVAVSRARRRLFVIDGKESKDGLWWFVSDEQNLSHALAGLSGAEAWSQNTGLLVRGIPESFDDDRDDPRGLAERFEREGLANSDSYLLKQASVQYDLADDSAKSNECRAVAELLEGRYREAGDNFKKAGLFDKAIAAYWRGHDYRDIAETATAKPEYAKRPECRVAAYLSGTTYAVGTCRTLLEQLHEHVQHDDAMRAELRAPQWKDAVELAVKKSLDRVNGQDEPEHAGAAGGLGDLLISLERYGLKIESKFIARLHDASGRHSDALMRLVDDGSEFYRDVKARSLIQAVGNIGREYSPHDARVVADYYLRKGDCSTAARYFWDIGDSNGLFECLYQSLKTPGAANPKQLIETVVSSLVTHAEWDSLLGFVGTGRPKGSARERWTPELAKRVLKHLDLDRTISRVVVPQLARSSELSRADGKTQAPVSEFLAKLFIKSGSPAEWQSDVSWAVAGSAIERAGKDIDALRFYETWRDANPTPEDRHHAERRWVVCKLRQARREDKEGHDKRAGSYRSDASKVMEKYGWKEVDDLDSYPELPPLPALFPLASVIVAGRKVADSSLTSRSEGAGRIGPVSYRIIANKGWVNFDWDDGSRARLFLRERRVDSDNVTTVDPDGRIHFPDSGIIIGWHPDGRMYFHFAGEECMVDVPSVTL